MTLNESIQELCDAIQSRAKSEELLRIVKFIQDNPEAPEGLNYPNWLITQICDLDLVKSE
jgi:hypothetical protein